MKSQVQSLYDNKAVTTLGIFSVPMRDKVKICERQLKAVQNLGALLESSMVIRNDNQERLHLLAGMLNPDPARRINPLKALTHP